MKVTGSAFPLADDMSQPEKTGTGSVKIAIRVLGFEAANQKFSEDTHSLAVDQAGARIVLKQRVASDDVIRIINLENHREADFRVVGPTRLAGSEVAEWGVECVESGRDIWGIVVPPPASPTAEASALLECRACHKQGKWPVTLMEIQVLDATGVINRVCDRCAKATYWTYADVTRRPREFPSSEPVAPPPREAEVKKWTSTRADKRVSIKLPAFVRNQKGEEETTQTENVSKGGIAVNLAMELKVGDIVTVVCPYTPGGQNIEQKANVRHRAAFSFGERRRYGLRYIH